MISRSANPDAAGLPENLIGSWERTVRRAPEATALIDCATGRRWSRAELAAAAGSWRAGLPPGLDLRGHYVALAEVNGAGWLAAFLGLLEAGAVPILFDPGDPAEVRVSAAWAVGASWLWDGRRLEPMLPGARRRRKRACLAKLTSGSTGGARTFPFTDAQMIADGRQVCATMGIGEADLNLGVIPFGHSYALGNVIVPLLVQGTALACGSGPFPQAIAADCRTWRPTVFPAVPVILRMLIRAQLTAEDLESLRLVISAGSPLAPADAQAFHRRFGKRVHGFYGTSETGGICYDRTGQATLAGTGVGAPLDGVRVSPGRGRRFTVESAAVMGSGRHRPADLGVLSPSGELALVGRVGRTIKIGGKRLDPAEVERTLKSLPGVGDAIVLQHPARSDGVAAVVVAASAPADLRAALNGRLAPWKIPDHIAVVPAIALTPRGKPDLVRIAAMFTRP